MIIQKWTAKIAPLRLGEFIEALKALNALYRQHGRVEWGRVHHELYGGHVIWMEREFPDIASLDADESRAQEPDIREAKKRLLDAVVPGTVEITHYQTREV